MAVTLIEDLVVWMREVIDAHPDHTAVFALAEGQFEDWYRGEFLAMLHARKGAGEIDEWGTQVSPDGGPGQMDLSVSRGGEHYAIELKACLIGKQGEKGATLGPGSYLDPDCIGNDIEKLARWKRGRRFVILFFHKKPREPYWSNAVNKLANKFPGRTLEVSGDPNAFPVGYLICVLELK